MLDGLRAGGGSPAAVEDAARGQMTHAVGPLGPPLRALAAGLIELEHAVGLRPAEVERDAPAGDDGPRTVVRLAPGFVLVEAEVEELPQVVARLRNAASDDPFDAAGERVGGAEVVLRFVPEKRRDVAERGEAHAQHVRILG